MNAKLARALVDAGADAGVEIELYEDYSGRGMFGATTAAVTMPTVAELVKATAELFRSLSGDPAAIVEFADLIDRESFREDNLGRDVVIY